MNKSLVSWFDPFYKEYPLISVHGHPHAGKTTYAMMLSAHIVSKCAPNLSYCIWIQASEPFSVKRFKSLFTLAEAPELLSKFLIIPKMGSCANYSDQLRVIQRITDQSIPLPTNVRVIVIDNISHHVRYKRNSFEGLAELSRFHNDFYNQQLFPLYMFCKRNQIVLILIHEATSDVKTGEITRFFRSLYDRIASLNIELCNSLGRDTKTMRVSYDPFTFHCAYTISSSGLLPII